MKFYSLSVLLIFASGIALMCCNDPEPLTVDRGEEYFPLITGKILEYRVDSIIFDDAGSVNVLDTFSAFVRERVIDAYAGTEGDTIYRVQREYRMTQDQGWIATGLWTASRSTFEGVRAEGNQRLTKMEFPLYKNRKWDPTKYVNELINIPVGSELINMYSYWNGEVISINQPEQIGSFAFDNVMTCMQADDDNELERRFVLEKYAKGIGLVFRMDTIVDSRCERLGEFGPCIGQSWMQKGEKGYIMKMELVAHN